MMIGDLVELSGRDWHPPWRGKIGIVVCAYTASRRRAGRSGRSILRRWIALVDSERVVVTEDDTKVLQGSQI